MSDDARDVDAYHSALMSLRAKEHLVNPPAPPSVPLAPPARTMVNPWASPQGFMPPGMFQPMTQQQMDMLQAQAMQAQQWQQLANSLQNISVSMLFGHAPLRNSAPAATPAFRHSGKLKRIRYLENTLGWRAWKIADVRDVKVAHHKDWLRSVRRATQGLFVEAKQQLVLQSPQQETLWEQGELRCEKWDKDEAVRGKSGIHALLAPENWRDLAWEYQIGQTQITGLVERMGKFVLGEDGWRAEWVIIRELSVPTQDLADKLKLTYPEVTIHVDKE